MSLELANYIVKVGLEKGAQDVIAIVTRSDEHMFRFANNSLTIVKNWSRESANMLIGINKKTIVVSLTKLDKDTIDRVVDKVVKTSKYLEPDKDYTQLPGEKFEYKSIPDTYDPKIEALENASEYVDAAINAALKEGVEKVAGVLVYNVGEKFLATSTGIEASEKGTSIKLSVRAFCGEEASGHGVEVSRVLSRFNPERPGREAGEYARRAVNPIEGEPGTYETVLSPLVVANLFGDVAFIGASAFMVEAGFSFFADKLGEKVASDVLTVYDDGRYPNGYGSTMFDDEGTPTTRTVIIEKGVLKSLLHNNKTARKFQTTSTGNAGWVIPHPLNVVIEPGSYTLEDMISQVDNGIFVTNNWYTRFQNYREGIFSTICRDAVFKIRNGELAEPLKGLRISGRMLDLLQNISALSKERVQIQWWEAEIPAFAPYMLIKNVNFTKATL